MQFHGQRRKLPLPVVCIKMYGNDIEVVESCTHVGITLNARHSAGDCVEQAVNKLRRDLCRWQIVKFVFLTLGALLLLKFTRMW